MSSEWEANASFFKAICSRDGVGRGLFVEFFSSSQIGVPDDSSVSFDTILMGIHQNRKAKALLNDTFHMETVKYHVVAIIAVYPGTTLASPRRDCHMVRCAKRCAKRRLVY